MGRAIVVTGASNGVGHAIVRALADEGADIGLIDRSIEGLEGAVAEVRATGQWTPILPLDVADVNAVEAAAAGVEDEPGSIDI